MLGENEKIKRLKKNLKKTTPVAKEYVEKWLDWLNKYMETPDGPDGPSTQDAGPGDTPPLPPPRK